MSGKIYLHLLFFCGILFQGIFAALSDKNTGLSSDSLVRKRRVINHLVSGSRATRIETVKYIVKIREANRSTCAGVILSHYTVITAASCVPHNISVYHVLSGAASQGHYHLHEITSKSVYSGSPPRHLFDGIALVTVDPPFQFNRTTGYIPLHTGPVVAGTLVTVSGYGYLYPLQPGTDVRQRLRSITLPIMNHEHCKYVYGGRFGITDKHICTYCTEQHCARGDAGAPLVANQKLVAIHVWKGEHEGQMNPDVYINIGRADYSAWIREHSLLL